MALRQVSLLVLANVSQSLHSTRQDIKVGLDS